MGGCGVANTGEMTVGGNVVCGIPAEQLEGLVRDRTKPLQDLADNQKS